MGLAWKESTVPQTYREVFRADKPMGGPYRRGI